jgi:murein DD-endopeptidase MepM/ murein hydrolase activator NlpD
MRRPLDHYTKITTYHGDAVRGSKFGKHLGTDYATPVGTPVVAPVSGVIRSVTTTPLIGKQIELEGDDGMYHRFAHLSAQHVVVGQRVSEGNWLGLSGNTGSSSTGPHCHWDTRKPSAWDASFSNYIDNEAAVSVSSPQQAPVPAPKPAAPKREYVQLPSSVAQWRFYAEGGPYAKGKERAFLKPAKFGGLEYAVLGRKQGGAVVVIETKQFGRGAIWTSGTSAKFITK